MTANSPNGVVTATPSSALSPAAAWKATLSQLEHQMAKATFNQWLRRSRFVAANESHFVVQVESANAVVWLTERLGESITSTLSFMFGGPATVEFITEGDVAAAAPGIIQNALKSYTMPDPPPTPQIEPEQEETFIGFDTPESNWTTTPDTFFTHLARREDGVVTKLVAQVIFHTWGQFEDKRRQLRVWEWPVTMSVLHEICGIKSRTSLYTAIWDARSKGYIVMRPLTDPDEANRFQERYGYKPAFTLRLKQRDDAYDVPTTPRPGYGSRKDDVQSLDKITVSNDWTVQPLDNMCPTVGHDPSNRWTRFPEVEHSIERENIDNN